MKKLNINKILKIIFIMFFWFLIPPYYLLKKYFQKRKEFLEKLNKNSNYDSDFVKQVAVNTVALNNK